MSTPNQGLRQKLRHFKYCFDRAFADYRKNPQGHGEVSYAFYAEDLTIDQLFKERRQGFFVDVGAHRPILASNTYRLYMRGWRGLNIDAWPGSMADFNKLRPEDINLEMGVAATKGRLRFHVFNDPAMNTFDPDVARKVCEDPRFRIEMEVDVETDTLASILDKHLPAGRTVDMLNLDAEGRDLDILRSNDWSRFSPLWILVENHQCDIRALIAGEMHRYMESLGYHLYVRGLKTCFYSRLPKSEYEALLFRI